MSSRAMASAKNRRTSPFIMGNKTMVPPQPMNKTLSASQRVSQMQGNQSSRVAPRTGGPPPPVSTREEYSPSPSPQTKNEYGRSTSYGRRELSIPEAFAMLNRKVTMLEEILEEKGIEFEKHTMVGTKSSVDEKIDILRRDMEELVRDSTPDLNKILMQLKFIKEEKDNEISMLNNALHDLKEDFREFRNRFDHEEISISAVNDGDDVTLITYNDVDVSLEASDKSDSENISMQINENGEIEVNNEEEGESRENEAEPRMEIESVLEDVKEEVSKEVTEETISAS